MKNYEYGKFKLRNYQIEAYESIANHLRTISRLKVEDKSKPIGVYIEASVGAGKTAIMGAVCHRFVEMKFPVLCLARDLKLVEQNSSTFFKMRIMNSIYSASFSKSLAYKDTGVIISNEATASRAIESGHWDDYTPRALLIDECHQVGLENEDSQYMKIINNLNKKCLDKHNHMLIIIGFTGSPYRHTMTIKGSFWRECLYSIDTHSLVSMNYLVPTIFGFEVGHDKNLDYDFSEYNFISENGTSDFSSKELAKMEAEIIKDHGKLKLIIDEFTNITKDRNAAMITCSGVKHCKEVARHLPKGSSVIVNSSQSKAKNDHALEMIKTRQAKYLLQVGCLTTGYDEPIIDTSIILRKIGSLTLLTQLLGRGMRLPTDEHIDQGIQKNDHLVLDYSGTMEEMIELYENPILEECRTRNEKSKGGLMQLCPDCGTENSLYANRCIGHKNGNRCEFFFKYIECIDRKSPNGKIISTGCGAKNDSRSKSCRICGEWLNDPSESLYRSHYTDNDLIDVIDFKLGLTKDENKILISYKLSNGNNAKEIYDISKTDKWIRSKWYDFIKKHVDEKENQKKMYKIMNAKEALKYSEFIKIPTQITHRVNEKGYDVIAKKVF